MALLSWRLPGTHALRWMIQHHLKRMRRYDGAIDGVWGPMTIRGVQMTTRAAGSPTSVDGVGGRETASHVEYYVDGSVGDYSGNYPMWDGLWQGFHNKLGQEIAPIIRP